MSWADGDDAGARRLEQISAPLTAFFHDADSTEAVINPHDGRVWFDTWSRGRVLTDTVVPASQLERFLNVVATAQGTTFGPDAPLLAAELPAAMPFDGARLQAFAPPVTPGYAVVIRKRPAYAPPLDEYVERGRLPAAWRDVIGRAVEDRRTTVIMGPTGSGKTTFAGAMIEEVAARCPDDRLVILEDTPELRCPAANHLALRTTPEISFTDLLKATLRASPTRIVLGEVRDEAALAFLDASATGHPGGLCTTHAGTVEEGLRRLDRLAQRVSVSSQLPLVGDAVDLVVVLSGGNQNRRVVDLVKVSGFTPEAGFSLHRCTERGQWTAA